MPVTIAQARRQDRRERDRNRAKRRRRRCSRPSPRAASGAVRDYARKLDKWSGDDPGRPRRRSSAGTPAVPGGGASATSTSPPDQVRALRRGPAREPLGFLGRDCCRASTTGQAPRARQRRGLLRADRPLCAHRLRLHVDRDRQGGGRQDGDRLLDPYRGRRHPSRTCSMR